MNKDWSEHFPKGLYIYIKMYSTLVVIKEMENKVIMGYNYISHKLHYKNSYCQL